MWGSVSMTTWRTRMMNLAALTNASFRSVMGVVPA